MIAGWKGFRRVLAPVYYSSMKMVYYGSRVLISSYGARSRQGPMLIRGAITVDDQKTLRVLARDYVEKTPRKVLALPFSN